MCFGREKTETAASNVAFSDHIIRLLQSLIIMILFQVAIITLCWTAVNAIVSSYCGFPEGEPLEGTCARDANNRLECEASYYVGVTLCFWDDAECTSGAVSTGEDLYCPTIANQETCEEAYFFGFRYCAWYEPSMVPSSLPSGIPSLFPSDKPSSVPSNYPTEYCGIPFVEDPWAFPRQICSNATNKVDCFRSFLETPIKCFWRNGSCISELVDTGEDEICPIVTNRDVCNTVSHTLDRQCFWYEPTGPTQTPSAHPSAAPSPSPSTPFPTIRPTSYPTPVPSEHPQLRPTIQHTPPVNVVTAPLTGAPSISPSQVPSENPSTLPTATPSLEPSTNSSKHPTTRPSVTPLATPSHVPTPLPSQSPSHSPTASPSESPSSSPTLTPIEDLITVCHCNRETQCHDGKLEEGYPLYLCLSGDPNFIVLNSIESLMLRKNILEQLIAKDATWFEGSFALQTGNSAFFLLISINIRDEFFDENLATPTEMLVEGQVRYNRKVGNTDEAIFSFQLGIPIKNTPIRVDKVVDIDQDSHETDVKEAEAEKAKKKTFNVRLWTPIAVLLVLLVLLSIKLVVDLKNEY